VGWASENHGPQRKHFITTVGDIWWWSGFIAFVVAMLALDLGFFQRKPHKPSLREALVWSMVWVGLALLFHMGLYLWFGPQCALEFFTGYLIEKALSIDNVFVILVILTYLAVPAELHHKILFWGIFGALVMRCFFVVAGAALLRNFHWTIYIFGALLLITGLRLFVHRESRFEPLKNPLVRLFSAVMPVAKEYRGTSFTVVEAGRRHATPLLLALVAVEASDLLFALDSIPAIFAITPDPFIVFTSNVFAMLGLRSLYFLLAGVIGRFRYLKAGLALTLAFVGLKMLLAAFYDIPTVWSLGVVALLIGGSILLSVARTSEPSAGRPFAPGLD
jgi:tellurite resistance protein TerC